MAHHKRVVWQAPGISPDTKTRLKSQEDPKPLPGMTLFPRHSMEPRDSRRGRREKPDPQVFCLSPPKTPVQPQCELFAPAPLAWA